MNSEARPSDASRHGGARQVGPEPEARMGKPPSGRVKMERGISRATDNHWIVDEARLQVQQEFSVPPGTVPGPGTASRDEAVLCDSPDSAGGVSSSSSSSSLPKAVSVQYVETPVYTFSLPDLTSYAGDFRDFLVRDLIEVSSLNCLENGGRLNWWYASGRCQRLWPLATTGDGNCLLHAASLAMWGFHDRLLTLRKALHAFLSSSHDSSAIYRRWRWQNQRHYSQCGLTLSQDEWQHEWESVLALASAQPRSLPLPQPDADRRCRISWPHASALYESLEEVHVYALANVIRRPIIVIADEMLRDANGDALAPIPFGGVFLPLENHAADCHKSPLMLTYNAGHFSALVTMQQSTQKEPPLPAAIPVTDSENRLLPLQFSIDPGPNFPWNDEQYVNKMMTLVDVATTKQVEMLSSYLTLVQIPVPDWAPGNPHCSRSKTGRQIQSVAKQFGTLGKKLKKNLLGLSYPSHSTTFEATDHGERRAKSPISSACFLLCAAIQPAAKSPYQSHMVHNYMQEARKRFEEEKEQQTREKAERAEAADKQKLDLYLSGGWAQCVTPDCEHQGTADTSYLCKDCFAHQRDAATGQVKVAAASQSTFYVDVLRNEMPTLQQNGRPSLDTVDLPSEPDERLFPSQTQPCKNEYCHYYGTSQLNNLCSRCYQGSLRTTKAAMSADIP